MKPFPLISSMLAISLVVGAPTLVVAHAGHGDEFQSQGGVQRVKINAETDQVLGIVVTQIAPSAKSSSGVMVPSTALVEADGKKLVFVQYENFYEPVSITTGATRGELIEVTQGLSVGEKLVTQGSLSLYAESRKTQAAPTSPNSTKLASPQTDDAHERAHAQGLEHSHDEKPAFPTKKYLAITGGAVALLAGAIVVVSRRKKKSIFSNKKGDV